MNSFQSLIAKDMLGVPSSLLADLDLEHFLLLKAISSSGRSKSKVVDVVVVSSVDSLSELESLALSESENSEPVDFVDFFFTHCEAF